MEKTVFSIRLQTLRSFAYNKGYTFTVVDDYDSFDGSGKLKGVNSYKE